MKNGNIIGESEMSYLITDDSLLPYQLQLEERLLDHDYFKRSLKRWLFVIVISFLKTQLVELLSHLYLAFNLKTIKKKARISREKNI